jgi:hypothetical protein
MKCPFCITPCGTEWCPYTEEESMKKSEMIDCIKGDLARMDLDFLHGRNLDKTSYHDRVEMLSGYFILFAERYGMLPPRAHLPKLGVSDNAWEPENEA